VLKRDVFIEVTQQRLHAIEEAPTDKYGRRKYIQKPTLKADRVWSSSSGLREGLTFSSRKVKVKQSRYRPGVAQRVPGS
jgi:hypothetical protein